MLSEIEHIVGVDKAEDWLLCNPTMYHIGSEPYGLMFTDCQSGMTYIYGCARDNGKFTKDMIKRIISLYNTESVCLITDSKLHQLHIRKVLERYNFIFVDGEDGYLYSFHFKGE